ncbi:MAG: ArsA-related P-loop ATPase, partial [Actinomycetota bacterium]
VIRRFIDWFTDFGIPVGGVIVNQVITTDDESSAPEFVQNRISMQRQYLKQIQDEFGDGVRGALPLYDDEVRGPASLQQAAAALFVS